MAKTIPDPQVGVERILKRYDILALQNPAGGYHLDQAKQALDEHYRKKYLSLVPEKQKHTLFCNTKARMFQQDQCNCGAKDFNKAVDQIKKAIRG